MTSTPSRIRYRDDGSRYGKLLAVKSYSNRDPVVLKDFVVGVDIVSFLAWKHVQERNGVVVSSLPSRLEGCDFHWGIEMRDDQSSANQGVRQLVAATTNTTSTPRPSSVTSHTRPTNPPELTPNNNGYWTLPQHTANHNNNDYWTIPQGQRPVINRTLEPPRAQVNDYWTLPQSETRGRYQDRQLLTTITIIDHPDLHPSSVAPSAAPQQQQQVDESDSVEAPPPQPPAEEWLFPFALTGPTRSNIAHPLSTLGSAYEIPLPMPAPYGYFHSIGVTHCANLFSQDAWGRTYNTDLRREAKALGITMVSFGYDTNEEDIEATLEQLKQSGMRYIYAIIKFDWEFVLETAYQKGIIGTDQHVWIGAEATDWTDDGLELSRHPGNSTREYMLTQALNGVGSLSIYVEESTLLNAAMEDFLHNTELQQEYVNAHPEAFIFQNYSFAESVNPSASFYHQMFYDATYSIGLAACNTPGLFTGSELYETLVNLQFEGVTGNITFDPITGTRSPDSVKFRVDNVFLSDERSDENYTRFETKLAAIVVSGQVEHEHRFIYHDNTTIPPPSIEPVEHAYNLIPSGAKVVGGLMGAAVMFASVAICFWTWYYRNTFVVRASQPVFLGTICLGTFIMAAASIPMGMQGTEESRGLDAACMATVWMVFLGFVITLSALFSKTWRMNQIMQSGVSMRRIEVHIVDVMWPFVTLMTLNVSLLVAWTVVAPFTYVRTDGNDYDSYGRSLESYGHCTAESNNFLFFFIPLVVVDFMMVAVATYQSYIARKLPTEFSESSYLALSMGCLTETLALGGPILFAASSSPTTFYVIFSLLLFTTNLTILLPVFVPKYLHRNAQSRTVLRGTMHNLQSRSVARHSANQNALPRGRQSIVRHGANVSSSNSRVSATFNGFNQVNVSFQDVTPSWGGFQLSRLTSYVEEPTHLQSVVEE
ncbi:Gamma-aminobutyric acid (GABA) B receptor [Seminavis robusta]|uniref:Gamma-aminobutyric acid (GABA) B receptor n=1 Tax=Seminavis robusta TaxID=568900 RepID=A0A9N8EV19_9STRA|nr:Gamma-aminobutyric acid (GABA) B receptor [Seminavis robusta]|eukprot:Sro1650_g288710.1 Gamma-aminobutyric acid (GABA) B receptor (935) ;mRNA; f:17356-20230